MTNPYLSATTAAGPASDVDVAWDRGNDQWWDWYMSLADPPPRTGHSRSRLRTTRARCRPTTR